MFLEDCVGSWVNCKGKSESRQTGVSQNGQRGPQSNNRGSGNKLRRQEREEEWLGSSTLSQPGHVMPQGDVSLISTLGRWYSATPIVEAILVSMILSTPSPTLRPSRRDGKNGTN